MASHRMSILLLTVMLSTALMCSWVEGNMQSSILQLTNPMMGDYFIAFNLTIAEDNATWIFDGHDACKCRAACFALGMACQSWSFVVKEENETECRLTNEGPETTDLIEKPNARYFFRQSSVAGSYFWRQRNLYVLLKIQIFPQYANETCKRIPGHWAVLSLPKGPFDSNNKDHSSNNQTQGNGYSKFLDKIQKKADELGFGDTMKNIIATFFPLHQVKDGNTADGNNPLPFFCQVNLLGKE